MVGDCQGTRQVPHTQETLEKMAERVFELSRIASLARTRRPSGSLDLTESEFLTLGILAREEPQTIGEVQKSIGVVPAQMSRIIRSLEDREGGGYIKCSINPHDRRCIDVVLTDRGRESYQQYRSARLRATTEILAVLSPSDRMEFMRLMGLIHEHIARSLQGQ
jgi:DNA-binding MarR family transcriptional regulator